MTSWWLDELVHAGEEHLDRRVQYYRWLLEPMLERSGFTIEDCEFRRAVYAGYTSRKTVA